MSFLATGCLASSFYGGLKKMVNAAVKVKNKRHILIKVFNKRGCQKTNVGTLALRHATFNILCLTTFSDTQCRVSTLFTFSSALDKLLCFDPFARIFIEMLLPPREACRRTLVELLRGHHSSPLGAPCCKSTEARLILVQKQWLPVKERVWEIGGRGFREAEEGGGEG